MESRPSYGAPPQHGAPLFSQHRTRWRACVRVLVRVILGGTQRPAAVWRGAGTLPAPVGASISPRRSARSHRLCEGDDEEAHQGEGRGDARPRTRDQVPWEAQGVAADVEIVPGDRPGSFVLRMSGMGQSYVDLEDPTRLVFEYVRRIGDVIDVSAPAGEPVRVVHVGGAGLTLARYVATTRPRSPQVVLEPSAAVTDLVRQELPLPRQSGIKVRPVDGRAGIAALRDEHAELVVVDAFADARVPGELVTAAFFADVARVARAGRAGGPQRHRPGTLRLDPPGGRRPADGLPRGAAHCGAGDAAGQAARQPRHRRLAGGGAGGGTAGARRERARAVPRPRRRRRVRLLRRRHAVHDADAEPSPAP